MEIPRAGRGSLLADQPGASPSSGRFLFYFARELKTDPKGPGHRCFRLEINAQNSPGKIREFIIKVNTQIDVVAFAAGGFLVKLNDKLKSIQR
jgi:hypothetical protein